MTDQGDHARVLLVDVDEIDRLATWAAAFGPPWVRDDMHSAATVRMLEAIVSGTTTKLGTVAYRGAMQALSEFDHQAGSRHARSAFEAGTPRIILGVGGRVGSAARRSGRWDENGKSGAQLADPVAGMWTQTEYRSDHALGPTLDRLIDVLVERGIDRAAATEAIETLTDAATRRRGAPRAPRVDAGDEQRSTTCARRPWPSLQACRPRSARRSRC